ncbi:MAG: ABC transporter ATP-binding protein [Ignavibacteria bacterium]|jgi:ATP-binding cassette subfamily B protein
MNKTNSKKTKRKKGISHLIEIAGTKKWWLLASILLAVIATIAQFVPVIAVYLILEELADHAADIAHLNKDWLYTLGFVCLGAVGLFGILSYASLMFSHIAAFNILYEIRVKIAEKLTKLSMGFFNRKTNGEIKKVMEEDVERIELFVAHHIPDITSAVIFPLLMIGYLFYIDWRLAIASLVPLPISMLMHVKMMNSSDLYRKYHDSLGAMNSTVVEYITGMAVVKVFGATATSFHKLKERIYSYRDFSQKITKDYSTVYPGFLTAASSSLVFIIPISLILLAGMDSIQEFIPTVLLFLIVGGGMFFPLFKLMFVSGFLNQITVGVERIDEILFYDEISEVNSNSHPSDASIEFDNVSFAYDETTVLNNISFRAEPNTVTALVGPSGAGKTTVGLLSARFWDINKGTIRIGGVNIKEMKTEKLMGHLSFVFQDGFLFFDTIEENIRMGNNKATKNEVIEAAKAAQCHEFIEKLPDGYNTFVGEGGTYLSGGEQQRIGIARAILKNSPVIILDEATAYADPENEGKILDGLASLIKDKTVIIIAHRLSTIVNADRILVVDNGEIVQRGTHDELSTVEGLYKNMWETYSRSREWTIEKERGS